MPFSPSRRTILKLTGASIAAVAGSQAISPAFAATGNGSQTSPPQWQVEDLGPGHVAFPLMSGLMAGSRFYIGSRNLDPTRVIEYDPKTHQVTESAMLGPGDFVQSLAYDPDRNVLYAGIVKNPKGEPNIYAWDLDTHESRPVAAIDSLKAVRTLTVASDGTIYASGRERDGLGGPGIHVVDPDTGEHTVLATPDPNATQARGIDTTDTHVFLASGSNLAGGGDASAAAVFMVDRESGETQSILPPEQPFSQDEAARDLAVFGDRLYVGTESGGDSGWVAVFSLHDLSLEFSAQMEFKTVRSFMESEGIIYFVSGGLRAYDPEARKLIDLPGAGGAGGWGLGAYENQILAANPEEQAVIHYDLTTQTAQSFDLQNAGAPGDAQLGMSVVAGLGRVFVGGNGSVNMLDLDSKTWQLVDIPSEAKDGLIHDDEYIAGVYSSQGIWGYHPDSDEDPMRIIELPQDENRPQSLAWDDKTSSLLVGTQNDTKGGGAFFVGDIDAGTAQPFFNPLGDQLVRAVTSLEGLAYIGGDRLDDPSEGNGQIACWDIAAGTQVWRIDPDLGGVGISSLAAHGDRLFALNKTGLFIVLDRFTGEIIDTVDASPQAGDRARIVEDRGLIYGASPSAVFSLDPKTLEFTVIVDELDGQWYSGPRIAVNEDGDLFTLRQRNLIRVSRQQVPGPVTVKYQDADGNELAPDRVLSGDIGEKYQAEAATIAGYELAGSAPENASGKFGTEEITVIFVYKKVDAGAGSDGNDSTGNGTDGNSSDGNESNGGSSSGGAAGAGSSSGSSGSAGSGSSTAGGSGSGGNGSGGAGVGADGGGSGSGAGGEGLPETGMNMTAVGGALALTAAGLGALRAKKSLAPSPSAPAQGAPEAEAGGE